MTDLASGKLVLCGSREVAAAPGRDECRGEHREALHVAANRLPREHREHRGTAQAQDGAFRVGLLAGRRERLLDQREVRLLGVEVEALGCSLHERERGSLVARHPHSGHARRPGFGFDRRGEGMSHAVFMPDKDVSIERIAERATALDLGIETRHDRLTIASRTQLGGLALVAQSAPPSIHGQRTFQQRALLPCQKLFHIGMVVRDRELAVGNYQRLLGIDEFLRMELHTDQGLRVWIDGAPVVSANKCW